MISTLVSAGVTATGGMSAVKDKALTAITDGTAGNIPAGVSNIGAKPIHYLPGRNNKGNGLSLQFLLLVFHNVLLFMSICI